MMEVRLFWIMFTGSLFSVFAIERLINIVLVLFTFGYSSVKSFSAKQVVVSQANVASSLFVNGLLYVVKMWMYLFVWWFLVFLLVLTFCILYVTYEEFPQIWISFMMFYNANLGPWVSYVLLIPLYLINLLFKTSVPFWNALVWFYRQMLIEGILPMLMEDAPVVLQFAEAFFMYIHNLVDAIIAYIGSFQCIGESCLVPGVNVMNVISMTGNFRQMVALSVKIARNMCSYAAAPLDLFSYPFMDLNFAEALHNLVNALLQLFVGIPYHTAVRCALSSENSFKIMMCTPDIAPFFNYMAAFLTSTGYFLDNWLNIALVILEQVLTGSAPACETVKMGLLSDIMRSDVFFASSRPTTVIGLNSWIYAVTDGQQIVYKGQTDSASKLGSWPYAVDSRFGIAAVSYSKVNSVDVSVVSDGSTSNTLQTTSMLGCNCTDGTDSGVSITCAVAPMEGWLEYYRSDYLLNVVFPSTHITQGVTCDMLDIHVKSVRWSFYRYAAGDVPFGSDTISMPTLDCINSGTCRQVDATVWVVPRCGGNTGNTQLICLPTSVCFPYCMGTRLSGAGKNNIILAGAKQWKQGRTLLHTDCNVYSSTPSSTTSRDDSTVAVGVSVVQRAQSALGPQIPSTLYSLSTSSSPECFPTAEVFSRISNPSFSNSVYNTYSGQQPFVITGDVVFTPKDLGGNIFSVVVDRLTGDQENAFTMASLNQEFPAEPPLNVPALEYSFEDQDKLLIPYSTRMSPSPAVASKNYVFYASNPDYNVYAAYLEYCTKPAGEVGKFGLIITSSYGPIRIYRVRAYARCAAYSCGAGVVRSIDFDGFRTEYNRKCDYTFNTSITQLEYLNEDNIAVVLSSSPIKSYNRDTMRFGSSTSTVYWLNPATMQISTTIWQAILPTSNAATLCPAMQRLPRFGSFIAELANAAVYLVAYFVKIPMYFPGIVPIWQDGGQCPQSSYGHSMLASCGADILSLEDTFSALADAQSIFWHALSSVVFLIQSEQQAQNNPVTDILLGMAEYGEGTMDLWAVRQNILMLADIPMKEQLTQFWGVLQSGSFFTALNKVQGNVIMWVRFSYSVLAKLVLVVVRSVLMQKYMTEKDIWQTVWHTLYESKAYYEQTVVKTNQMACAGLQLMFGVDNPWAELAYYYCTASVSLFDNVFNTLLNVNIYIPMAVCVCKNSRGRNPMQYALSECAGMVPVQLRPELFMLSVYMHQDARGDNFCDNVLAYTNDQIKHSMDPWFSNMFLALKAAGESIDYALIVFDEDAGQCLDFKGDPHVVAIVPQPVDYFQKCGATSLCKSKCSAEWMLFQEYKMAPVPLATVSVTYESMFFPGQYDASQSLGNATAILQIVDYQSYCVQRAFSQDLVLAVAEVGAKQVWGRVWCVPQAPSSSVYVSTTALFGAVNLPGDIMQSYFISASGDTLALLLRVGSNNKLFLMYARGSNLTALPDPPPQSDYELVDIPNIWPVLDTVCCEVLYKTVKFDLVDGRIEVLQYHYCWMNKRWVQHSNLDFTLYANNNYMMTKMLRPFTSSSAFQQTYGDIWIDSTSSYLFLSKQNFLSSYVVTLVQLNQPGSIDVITTPLSNFDGNMVIPNMPDAVASSRCISDTYVLAATPTGWNWLTQIRFNAQSVQGAYQSVTTQVQVTPQGNCNEISCEGCPTLLVQRLCQAYNKCALTQCVGTLVNQVRPLCAVGLSLSMVGTRSLVLMQSAWVIVAEMMGMVLQVSLSPGRSLNIEWPEDVFMGYICSSKDLIVEFWAIITSTVNSVLHLASNKPSNAFQNNGQIDRNADAKLTIVAVSTNSFLTQLTLLPLYNLITMKQIMLCKVNGVLTLVDNSGYTVRVKSAELLDDALDIVAGTCLTESATTAGQYSYLLGGAPGSFSAVNTVSNAVNFLLLQAIDPFIHVLDGTITYAIGIIHSFAVLIMAMNMEKCNPPNYFLQEQVKCACDDTRLSIPDIRAREGIREYALWCTGTLGMIDSNNQPFTILNPYTYSELRTMASNMQSYVQCVSTSYACQDASVPIFQAQGVTLTNVLVKCRDNFNKKQWDPRAFSYFDPRTYSTLAAANKVIKAPAGAVRDCLIRSYEQGAGPQACMEQYISTLNLHTPEEYWVYEPAKNPAVQYTDACMVFTGPGLVRGIPKFAACVDGGSEVNGNCTLNPTVWEVISTNDVPVAEQHIVLHEGDQVNDIVQRLYTNARALVVDALLEAIYRWTNESNPDVQVEFFSTEGDAVHQIMDCIFMGPYSRVNYWPIPRDIEDLEKLHGPAWWRDLDEGKTRKMDIDTCPSSEIMPFTCGSQGRRSVIRYFVKKVLSGQIGGNTNTTLIQRVVVAQLRDMIRDWENVAKFSCVCANSDPNAPVQHHASCCKSDDQDSWLPANLRREFQDINASHVLDALDQEYAYIYNLSIQDFAPWIEYNEDYAAGMYDWSQSERAKDEALYNTQNPTYNYSDNLMSVQPGTRGLWTLCHASLKQIFFTLPVYEGRLVGIEDIELYDGDPAKLEQTIRKMVDLAWEHSPTYRHYHPRFHPSPSSMCSESGKRSVQSLEDGMLYDDFTQASVAILRGADVLEPSLALPMYKYDEFSMGHDLCTCAWNYDPGSNMCIVPVDKDTCQQVCQIVSCAQTCKYASALDPVLQNMTARFASWKCPLYEMSSHWFLLDAPNTQKWMADSSDQLFLSTRDLLRYGRSGLRLGNVQDIAGSTSTYVNAQQRTVPLDRGVLHSCDYDARIKLNPMHLAEELFPMAQGIAESGAAAYCLRYIIEKARFTVLEMVQNLSYADNAINFLEQKETMYKWGRKCGSQLYLLHLCVSLNVFQAPIASNTDGKMCVYFEMERSPDFYTTADCLVYIDGEFYDPCRCMMCEYVQYPPPKLDRNALKARGAECKLRFDPRGKAAHLNAPIGLWEGVGMDYIEYLNMSLLQQLLNDSDAVGNTAGNSSAHAGARSSWMNSEGFMSSTADECDMIMDYWPDDWDYPVGYHVSTTCDGEDNAYRSFMNSFTEHVDRSDPLNPRPVFLFHNDLMRAASDLDTYFGISGLCRQNNFGMPLVKLNTMVVCTRVRTNEQVDITIPQFGTSDDDFSPESCASSSSDLPWETLQADTLYSSVMFSVGTVPNMPSASSAYYPEALDTDMFDLASERVIGTTWDASCPNYPLRYCTTSDEETGSVCPAEYTCRARRCSGVEAYVACTSNSDCTAGTGVCVGVCLHSSVQCVRHSDCRSTAEFADYMCTGSGRCVQPQIIVQNENVSSAYSVQFRINGTTQDAQTMGNVYSLVGGSYWGYMGEDLLSMHGMCSYTDWYKYKEFYLKQCQTVNNISGDVCWIDGAQTTLLDLSVPMTNNSKLWWPATEDVPPNILYVRPTVCDRDHERLEGFTFVQPRSADVKFMYPGKQPYTFSSEGAMYDNFTRVYESENGRRVPIARINMSRPEWFLFGTLLEARIGPPNTENPLQKCNTFRQCLSSPFTRNFNLTTRTIVNVSPNVQSQFTHLNSSSNASSTATQRNVTSSNISITTTTARATTNSSNSSITTTQATSNTTSMWTTRLTTSTTSMWTTTPAAGNSTASNSTSSASNVVVYNKQNTFICGAIGYLNAANTKCVLDRSVFPLYNLFCDRLYRTQYSGCSQWSLMESVRSDVCSKVQPEYNADYQSIVNNVNALADMFFMFDSSFVTYFDIMKTTDCAMDIYTHIVQNSQMYSTRTLYYPMAFILKEFPFDWFYQCILLNTNAIIRTDIKSNQNCPNYRSALGAGSSSTTDGELDLLMYLRYVRKGITYRSFEAFANNMTMLGLAILDEVAQDIFDLYPDKQDGSIPTCSRFRYWQLGLNDAKNTLIYNSFDPFNCVITWQMHLLEIINRNFAYGEFSDKYEINETLQLMGYTQEVIDPFNQSRILVDYDVNNWRVLLSETYRGSTFSSINWQVQQTPVPTISMVEFVKLKLQENWGVLQDAQSVALRFDFSIAAVNPNEVLDSRYLIQQSVIGSTLFSEDKGNYDVRCAFPPSQVSPPVNLQTCSGSDLWWTCESKECVQTIPIFSHSGSFSCRYDYLDKFEGANLDVTNANAVYEFLYKYMQQGFETKRHSGMQRLLPLEDLPFFRDTEHLGDWQMDFTNEIDYTNNNQPDTTKSVMCTIADVNIIQYNRCNHPHWFTIRDHANKHYYHSGAIVIPAQTQLQWKVKSKLFLAGFISSFSSMEKTGQESYMDDLFNPDKACVGGKDDWQEKVCYRFNTPQEQLGVINPWLHGYYNPYERCDVSYGTQQKASDEFIDTYIYPLRGVQYPHDMPWGALCLSERGQIVTKPGPSRFSPDPATPSANFPYNLCHHKLNQNADCTHDQGLLGGDDGLFVGAVDSTFNMFVGTQYEDAAKAYTVAKDMYTRSKWVIPDDFRSGLFAGGRNPLWEGNAGRVGLLQIPEYELGVHTIGLQIVPPIKDEGETYSIMLVSKLPLGESMNDINKILSGTSSQPVQTWVPSLLANIRADHENNMLYYDPTAAPGNGNVFAPMCPLKRFAFYGRNSSVFRPVLPLPPKAFHLFSNITSGAHAHPTMTQNNQGSYFGSYKTVNGFCFCPLVLGVPQTQCQVHISVTSTCSLVQTVNTLRAFDDVWYDSHVFAPVDVYGRRRVCAMQIDWPVIPNKLRDGMLETEFWSTQWARASDPTNKQCHVLDRLRPFQYKYKNTRTPQVDQQRNTVDSGVCKTGRVSDSDATQRIDANARCVLLGRGAGTSTHTCDSSSAKFTLQRKTPLTERTLYMKRQNFKRRRCNQCAKPPAFVSAKTGGTKEEYTPLQAESSFGVPYKLSTTRVLAADLRKALQDGGVGHLIDEQYWTPDLFLKTYLTDPHKLLKPTVTPPQNAENYFDGWKIDDSHFWKDAWVYCPNNDAFKSKKCTGYIDRDTWTKNKLKACPHMVKAIMQQSNIDPMAHASFANIDRTTNKVAGAIAQARELIIQANCIASGNAFCMPQPFTYHPATYKTTNQAWVHDTVTQYYLSVDAQACQLSNTNQAFYTYLAGKQDGCPANTFYMFEQFLRIIRFMVTNVALLVASLASMAIKLIAAPFSATAKSSLMGEWTAVKQSFSGFMGTTSDMLVDMFMNSGALGKRLASWIRTSCNKLNDIIDWFGNMWCIFLTKYLYNTLGYIQNFIGGAGFGLQLVQQFIMGMLSDILPISFILRYMTTPVANLLSGLYSQPSKKSEQAKQEAKATKLQPQSKLAGATQGAEKASKTSSALKKTGNFVTSLKGAVVFAVVATVFDMVADHMAQSAKNSILPSLWPFKGDLFDFQDAIDVVADIMYYIFRDSTCTSYLFARQQVNYTGVLSCPKFEIDPVNPENPAKSIDATLCWATATPSLGQSSAYSCSPSSTCCAASGCSSDKSKLDICANCPAPTVGVAQFACDNMVCKCNVPIQQVSQCAANAMCDGNSQCDLISSISSVSYGTLPCKECPGKLVCLAYSAGVAARCSCLMDFKVNMATCYESAGTITYPDPSALCGYLPRLTEASTQSTFEYNSIMVVQCKMSLRTICAYVYMDNGVTVQMPISYTVRLSNSRQLLGWDFMDHFLNSSSSASRVSSHQNTSSSEKMQHKHTVLPVAQDNMPPTPSMYSYQNEYDLLTYEDVERIMHLPLWNESSAPCSALAHAYQHHKRLGVIDEHELRKCAYWRWVGRKMIADFNLTALHGRETFLVSLDDFSAAIAQKDVLKQMLGNMQVAVRMVLMHPYMKPVRAFVIYVINQMEEALVRAHMELQRQNHTAGNNNDKEPVIEAVVDEVEEIVNKLPTLLQQMNESLAAGTQEWRRKQTGMSMDDDESLVSDEPSRKKPASDDESSQKKPAKIKKPSSSPRRKLLVTMSEIQAVQQYSAQIIQGVKSPPLAMVVAQSWVRGAFSWPPKYLYSISDCHIVTTGAQALKEILTVVSSYFVHFRDPKPVAIDRTLKGNLPNFASAAKKAGNFSAVVYQKTWAAWVYHNTLGVLQISSDDIVRFFMSDDKGSLRGILQTFYVCDFASVVTCSKHTRDLYMSFWVFIMMYLVMTILCNALGVPSLATMFLLSMPWFLLWYVYGMPFTCLPMLPSCLLDDLEALVMNTLPVQFYFPDELYCDYGKPGFVANASTCLRSCTHLGFTELQDPVVYLVCWFDSGLCGFLKDFVVQYSNSSGGISFATNPVAEPVARSLVKMHAVTTQKKSLTAYTICMWVNWINVVPLILLVLVSGSLVLPLLTGVVNLIPALVNMVLQIMVFNHVD